MAAICVQPVCVGVHEVLSSKTRRSNQTTRMSHATSQNSSSQWLQFAAPFVGSTHGLSKQTSFHRCQMPSKAIRAAVGTVVTEPVTKIQFPSSITAPGGSKELTLLGAGVREKKIVLVNVKVYAVGIYFDPSFASSLAEFKGKDLSNDSAFFKALSEVPVEKCIEIVLARDVDGETFWKALNESLAPRVKAAGGEGEKALAAFGDVLKTRKLNDKTGIFLTWSLPSTLKVGISDDATTLQIPSDTLASVESEALLRALFDVYLGAEPVSPSAKLSVAQTVASVL